MKNIAYGLEHIQGEKTTLEEIERQEATLTSPNGETIFCNEDYAEDLYNLYTGYKFEHQELAVGDVVSGRIFSMSEEEIALDTGSKYPVYIYLHKEGQEATEELLSKNIGDEVEVYIYDVETAGRQVTAGFGSRSKISAVNTLNSLNEALVSSEDDMDQVFDAKLVDIIANSGYLVDINGIKAFLPGSLAAPNKIINFEEKLGETLKVIPVSYSQEQKFLVVSHKKYIEKLIPDIIENLKVNTVEYSGVVTGTAKFGVFVEFIDENDESMYVTGMIHTSELDHETKEDFNKRNIKPGDKINFFIKEITKQNRIILTQKEESLDPWNTFNMETPQVVKTKISGIVGYGLFLEIEPGISGLLHVSEMVGIEPSSYSIGEEIYVSVDKIDYKNKKIYFSLPT